VQRARAHPLAHDGAALELHDRLAQRQPRPHAVRHHAAAELAGAINVLRSAYRELRDAATPATVKAAQSAGGGTVPAYLKKQISNYQDALSKLTGSG
jgi:hypothetical protein